MRKSLEREDLDLSPSTSATHHLPADRCMFTSLWCRSRPCDSLAMRAPLLITLQFPNAVVLNAVGRRNTQMQTKERKRKSAKEGKGRNSAQKSAKERFSVKIANNQVWNNRVCQRKRDDNKNKICFFQGVVGRGAERKIVQNGIFRGKRNDNKILKVKILLSRDFVVMAQAPSLEAPNNAAISPNTEPFRSRLLHESSGLSQECPVRAPGTYWIGLGRHLCRTKLPWKSF